MADRGACVAVCEEKRRANVDINLELFGWTPPVGPPTFEDVLRALRTIDVPRTCNRGNIMSDTDFDGVRSACVGTVKAISPQASFQRISNISRYVSSKALSACCVSLQLSWTIGLLFVLHTMVSLIKCRGYPLTGLGARARRRGFTVR